MFSRPIVNMAVLIMILVLVTSGCKHVLKDENSSQDLPSSITSKKGGSSLPDFALKSRTERQDRAFKSRDDLPDYLVSKLNVSVYSLQGSEDSHWDILLDIETKGKIPAQTEGGEVSKAAADKLTVLFTMIYSENSPRECLLNNGNGGGVEQRVQVAVPTSIHQQYRLPDVFQLKLSVHPECQPTGLRVDFDVNESNNQGAVLESNEHNNSLSVDINM